MHRPFVFACWLLNQWKNCATLRWFFTYNDEILINDKPSIMLSHKYIGLLCSEINKTSNEKTFSARKWRIIQIWEEPLLTDLLYLYLPLLSKYLLFLIQPWREYKSALFSPFHLQTFYNNRNIQQNKHQGSSLYFSCVLSAYKYRQCL